MMRLRHVDGFILLALTVGGSCVMLGAYADAAVDGAVAVALAVPSVRQWVYRGRHRGVYEANPHWGHISCDPCVFKIKIVFNNVDNWLESEPVEVLI